MNCIKCQVKFDGSFTGECPACEQKSLEEWIKNNERREVMTASELIKELNDNANAMAAYPGTIAVVKQAAAEIEALQKEVEAVRSAMRLIEADAVSCEQEAEAFKAKNDGINAYLMSTQAMAHRLDLKRLKP